MWPIPDPPLSLFDLAAVLTNLENDYDPTMATLGFAGKGRKQKQQARSGDDNDEGEPDFIDHRQAAQAIERDSQKRRKGEANEIDDLFSNKRRKLTEEPSKKPRAEDVGAKVTEEEEEEEEKSEAEDNEDESAAEEEEEEERPEKAKKPKKVSADMQNILGAIEGTKRKKKSKGEARAAEPVKQLKGQKETLEEKMARIKAEQQQQKGVKKAKKAFSMM